MPLRDNTFQSEKLEIHYFVSDNPSSKRNVFIMHNDSTGSANPDKFEILRKAEQEGITLLLAIYRYAGNGNVSVKQLAESASQICSRESIKTPIMVGSRSAGVASVYCAADSSQWISGAIVISPESAEEIYSVLYRVSVPVLYAYSRSDGIEVERTMFRYHDLTAGSRLIKLGGVASDIYIRRPSQFISLLDDYIDHAGT
ncbi:MAG: alpha/beta fold hydrolase [Thermoplasmataceae archaeon]